MSPLGAIRVVPLLVAAGGNVRFPLAVLAREPAAPPGAGVVDARQVEAAVAPAG